MENTKEKLTNKIIIDTVGKNGFIVIYEKDTKIRKQLHKFAKSKNFFHLSFVDEEKEYEKELKYWCESCDRFLNENEYRSIKNKLDQKFIFCLRCYDEEDLVDKFVIIKDGYMNDENYHISKWVKKNNSIIISNNIDNIRDVHNGKKKNNIK